MRPLILSVPSILDHPCKYATGSLRGRRSADFRPACGKAAFRLTGGLVLAPVHAHKRTLRRESKVPENFAESCLRTRYINQHITGTPDAPITIISHESKEQAIIRKGDIGLRLTSCRYLHLERFAIRANSEAGIRIDDGGDPTAPSENITLRNLTLLEAGREGVGQALHIAGARNVMISRCDFEGWSESAIEFVGSHDSVVDRCEFRGRDGYNPPNAIRIRGGSSNVTIRTSTFRWAGRDTLMIGGDSEPEDFRPAGARYEAIDAVVTGNRMIGGGTPIVWNTAQRGYVHHNTIVIPHWTVVQIMQKREDSGFLPCASGRFEENLVVYDKRIRLPVTVGPYTDFPSFTMRRNAWYGIDGRALPKLPIPESSGVYQVDPGVSTSRDSRLRMASTDERLQGIGADFYSP